MEHISNSHWFRNSPVNRPSLVAANKIFGTDMKSIKIKTVLLKNPEVRINIANIPISVLSLYINVTLSEDILYVNIIAFLASISISIKLITLERILNRRSNTTEASFTRINKVHALRCFTLSAAKTDNKSELLCAGLAEQRILLICSAKN